MKSSILANAPRAFRLSDVTLRLSALDQYEWAEHQAWIEDYVIRPPMPTGYDNVMRAIWIQAWPPRPMSASWWESLDSPGCFAKLVQIAFGKHQPNPLSDAEALALSVQILDESLVGEFVLRCMGSEIDADEKQDATTEKQDSTSMPEDDRSADSPDDRPESDEPGNIFYLFAKLYGWSHDDCMRLTLPQIRYYAHEGRPARTGHRKCRSTTEAQAAKRSRSVQ